MMAERLTAPARSPWVAAAPALIAIAVLMIVLAWYEWYSRPHGWPRISDYTKQAATWVKWLGIGLLGLLGWHLFKGGPLSRKARR